MYVFNDKVITLVLGAPGSGKSTFAARLVREANEIGLPVYCNYPVQGSIAVDMDSIIEHDLGVGVLIIDEAGLNYNSRNTKAFGKEHYHWFATTRHRRTQIFVIVQSWKRVDIVLRELATEVIMCRKGWFGFTTCRQYVSDIKLIEDKDGNAQEFADVFARIHWRCFWRPNYYHMFDSYHLDKEYRAAPDAVYPDELFPMQQPFGKRLRDAILGPPKPRKRRSRQRGEGEMLPEGEGDPLLLPEEAA